MLIKEQIPSFPKLIALGTVMMEVAHGATSDQVISTKYHSSAEREYAEDLALEKILSLLRDSKIRATGRASSEKKGVGKRWEGQQYRNHSKLRTYVDQNFWSRFVFQRTSWFGTARNESMEYADVMLVLEDCRQHLHDDVVARREPVEKIEGDDSHSDYSTPYINLMWQAIDEFKITAENQPIKETLVEWFLTHEIDGQRVSRVTAEYLASFVRLPSSRTGGNRPWKVRAQQHQDAE
jgi:hypothetical protein